MEYIEENQICIGLNPFKVILHVKNFLMLQNSLNKENEEVLVKDKF